MEVIMTRLHTFKQRYLQSQMLKYFVPRQLPAGEGAMHLCISDDSSKTKAQRLVEAMTEQEKLELLSGIDEFCIRPVKRLGLQSVPTSDATMGLRGWKEKTTVFPSAVAMAASFDRDLITEIGKTIGEECRAKGVGVLLGPGVNITRVPTCGRNFEYMGEDPYLAGEMASCYIKGVQSQGVITTVKHYACNNSDYSRHLCDSVVDERTLREIYLPAFKKAIEAGSLGVMTSYNLVNGVHAGEHPYLIGEILKGEWGFDNLVISDWNSLYSTVGTIKNGVDLEMPSPKYLSPLNLKEALDKGEITISDIDRHLLGIFNAFEKAGLFDRPLIDKKAKDATSNEHQVLALQSAREGICLLKNQGNLLPLKGKKLCLGGPNSMQVSDGGGSSRIIFPQGQEPQSMARYLPTVVADTTVLPSRWWRKREYREKVSQCEAVILVMGFDHYSESEAYDRKWELPLSQKEEIEQCAMLNSNTVVILQCGGAVETGSWITTIPSVVQAFYLGQSTSEAITDVLLGKVNPSARLPFTIANDFSDYQSVRNYARKYWKLASKNVYKYQGRDQSGHQLAMEYKEGLLVGYRQFDTKGQEVAFCFGHGLSYTSFSYESLVVTQEAEKVLVSFILTNSGCCDGAEVVQLYVHQSDAKVYRPLQELKEFSRVFLKKGESKTISFVLGDDAFSYYDIQSWSFVRDKGTFVIRLGSSSRDIRLEKTIE